MPLFRVAVHRPSVSGLPRDDIVNDFVLRAASAPSSSDFDAAADMIGSFYSAPPPGHTDGVFDYLAHDRDYTTGAGYAAFYAIPSTPGPMGSPVHIRRLTLTPPTLSEQILPEQVAVCLSFYADLTGVLNPRKYRGRIFVGSLNELALQEAAGAVAPQTVASAFNSVLRASAKDKLHTGMNGLTLGWEWRMWSPTDWTDRAIVSVSVDDRFDTQRRRLQRAGFRSTTVL